MGTNSNMGTVRCISLYQQFIGIRMDPQLIMDMTTDAFYLPRGTLMTWSRTRTVANARAVAMWLCRTKTTFSWIEIATIFKRDHSSVIHNYNKVNKMTHPSLIEIKTKLNGDCDERILQKQNRGSEDIRTMA